MQKTFISYRREDASEMAHRMYDWLVKQYSPNDVFIDVDSIQAGSDFRAAIEKAVINADVMLVVIGRSWLDVSDQQGNRRLALPDDFVRFEIEMAMRHNKLLIPVLVNGAFMPTSSSLPSSVATLSYKNAVKVDAATFVKDMERLQRVISNEFAAPPSTTPVPYPWFMPVWMQKRPYPWVTFSSFFALTISLAIIIGGTIFIYTNLTSRDCSNNLSYCATGDYSIYGNVGVLDTIGLVFAFPIAFIAWITALVQLRKINRQDVAGRLFLGMILGVLIALPGLALFIFSVRGIKRPRR